MKSPVTRSILFKLPPTVSRAPDIWHYRIKIHLRSQNQIWDPGYIPLIKRHQKLLLPSSHRVTPRDRTCVFPECRNWGHEDECSANKLYAPEPIVPACSSFCIDEVVQCQIVPLVGTPCSGGYHQHNRVYPAAKHRDSAVYGASAHFGSDLYQIPRWQIEWFSG